MRWGLGQWTAREQIPHPPGRLRILDTRGPDPVRLLARDDQGREHASLRICRGRGKQVSDRIRCEHGVAVDQQHKLRVLSERGGDSQVDSACESKISPGTQQTYVALAVAAIRAWFG